MTTFWLIALAMIALALAAILPVLLRARHSRPRDTGAAALEVYRERLVELEREHERGNLSEEGLADARADLERELLHEVPADDPESDARPLLVPARASAIAIALALPAIALLLYAATGQPEMAGSSAAGRLSQDRIHQIAAMQPPQRIDVLERYVDAHPQAPRAWSLLGEAYRSTGSYGDAVNAFARARALSPGDAWLTARQAESLLLANGRSFTRSVDRLLNQALDQDARNPLALMLAGHLAMARGNDQQAVSYWQDLEDTMPRDDQRRAMVEQLIARAEGKGGNASATGGDASANAGTAAAAGAAVTVHVTLDPSLRESAAPDDTVFVFARRPGGSGGPPLAVARTTVSALPTEITLSDAQSMTPAAKISQAGKVVITARVARSGDVRAQSGDLEGTSGTITVGAATPTDLTIDRRIE